MRLASFATSSPSVGRVEHLGAVLDDDATLVDLPAATAARLAAGGLGAAAAARIAGGLVPGDVGEFVENGELALEAARETVR